MYSSLGILSDVPSESTRHETGLQQHAWHACMRQPCHHGGAPCSCKDLIQPSQACAYLLQVGDIEWTLAAVPPRLATGALSDNCFGDTAAIARPDQCMTRSPQQPVEQDDITNTAQSEPPNALGARVLRALV